MTDAEIRTAYDLVGQVYRPWLQWFQPPNVENPVVRTDAYGFRKTFTAYDPNMEQPVNVLLGSSAVFGVGASKDGQTLSAWLGRLTNEPWLNFGGRAFNSTQELILFLLHRPKHVKRLVVCSGVNTIVLAGVAPNVDPFDGAFFGQSVVEGAVCDGTIGYRTALAALRQAIRGRPATPTMSEGDSRLQASIRVLLRDWLTLWELAPTLFVLQPCAHWVKKVFHGAERERFARPGRDHVEMLGLLRLYEPFKARILEVFPGLVDANTHRHFHGDEDLFFDHVHLTDLGYERLAQVIAEAL